MMKIKFRILENLKNIRQDLYDISKQEIEKIKDRELLIIELQHTNSLLQSKEKIVNAMTIMILSSLGILLYNFIKNIIIFFDFSKNITMKDVEYLKSNLPIFLDISVSVLFIFLGIFIYIIFIDLYNRHKIIQRKNLILNELKKISRYRYNKTE